MNGGGVRQKIRTKKKAKEDVMTCLRYGRLNPVHGRTFFLYDWRAPNRTRDPSNIVAGGRKVIEDALKTAGVIANDGWRHVLGFADRLAVDSKYPGVALGLLSETELGAFDLKGFLERGISLTPF